MFTKEGQMCSIVVVSREKEILLLDKNGYGEIATISLENMLNDKNEIVGYYVIFKPTIYPEIEKNIAAVSYNSTSKNGLIC